MRHFTKTHNDLKWLFPIAKTKQEAEKVFNYVEEQAEELAHSAGKKAIKRLYLNLFNIKKDYGEEGNKKEWDKYFRFHELENLFRHLAWDSKEKEGFREELVKLLEKSIFDGDALVSIFDGDALVQNLKQYLKVSKKRK